MQSSLESIRPHVTGVNKAAEISLHLYPDSISVSYKKQNATSIADQDQNLPSHILLHIDQEEIQTLTSLIANEQLTWDECVWILAETALAIEPALDLPQSRLWWGHLPEQVTLLPPYMYRIPRMEEVRRCAHKISRVNPSLEDIHHYLAQRFYIAHHIFMG